MTKDKDYKIEKKDEFFLPTKEGKVETWLRVWITTKGGTYTHRDISEDMLDKAEEILTAWAKKVDAI